MKKNILSMLACLGFASVICGDASAMQTPQQAYEALRVTSDNSDFSVIIKALVPADNTPEEAQRVKNNKNALNAWVETFNEENGDRKNGHAALDAILGIAGLYKNDLTLAGKLGTDRVSANLFTAWQALDGKALTLADSQERSAQDAVFKGLSNNDIIAVLTDLRGSFYSQEFVAERLRSAAKAIDANVQNVLNYLLGLYTNEDISKLYVVKEGKTLKVQQDAPAQDPQTVKEYVKDLLSTYGVTADDYIKYDDNVKTYIDNANTLLASFAEYKQLVEQYKTLQEMKAKADEDADGTQLGNYLKAKADTDSLPFFIRKGNADGEYRLFARPALDEGSNADSINNAVISEVTMRLVRSQTPGKIRAKVAALDDSYFIGLLREPARRALMHKKYSDNGAGSVHMGITDTMADKIAGMVAVDGDKTYNGKEITEALDGVDLGNIMALVKFLAANQMPGRVDDLGDVANVKQAGDLLVAAGLLAGDKALGEAPNKGDIKIEKLRNDRNKIYDSFSQVNLSLGAFASANVSALSESFSEVAKKLGRDPATYGNFEKFENVEDFIKEIKTQKGLTDLAKSITYEAAEGIGLDDELSDLDKDPAKLNDFLKAVDEKYQEARNLQASSIRYSTIIAQMKNDEQNGLFSNIDEINAGYTLTPSVKVVMKPESLGDLKKNDQFKKWVAEHAEDFGVKAAQQPGEGNINNDNDEARLNAKIVEIFKANPRMPYGVAETQAKSALGIK